MSVKSKHVCIVCRRVFPEGQGIVIKIGDTTLEFHSSRCFSKFARELLARIPYDEIKGYIKSLKEEYEELIKQKEKTKAKSII